MDVFSDALNKAFAALEADEQHEKLMTLLHDVRNAVANFGGVSCTIDILGPEHYAISVDEFNLFVVKRISGSQFSFSSVLNSDYVFNIGSVDDLGELVLKLLSTPKIAAFVKGV